MKKLATLDIETDPFKHGVFIKAFAAGFYTKDRFISYWSADCVERMIGFLESERDEYLIYIHNGGLFDLFYMLEYLHGDMRIINSRIVQAHLGKHEVRDSYAIMPFALEKYQKTKIDYETFVASKRERHRDAILSYLRDDCKYLYDLVSAYTAEFGNVLTIGSASLKQLRKSHTFKCGSGIYDAKLRTDYYYGGRNQCFKSGIIRAPINIYDVNSMYPFAMATALHPVSTGLYCEKRIVPETVFVTVEGKNYGAFPTRLKDRSLDFTIEDGIFHTSIHEFNAALETRTFTPRRILSTIGFSERVSFAAFVEKFYDARLKAERENDQMHKLFYKFVLNSCYGKFAQNPNNYFDYTLTKMGEYPSDYHICSKACTSPCLKEWTPSYVNDGFMIWKRHCQRISWFNVGTGASITGAARAHLLRGIASSTNPLYCDTDSLICENLHADLDNQRLGAWKLEGSGMLAAIAGKKLYAIFDMFGNCIKKANKGAILTPREILSIASGKTIESANPVPRFHFDGPPTFVKRNIRCTA